MKRTAIEVARRVILLADILLTAREHGELSWLDLCRVTGHDNEASAEKWTQRMRAELAPHGVVFGACFDGLTSCIRYDHAALARYVDARLDEATAILAEMLLRNARRLRRRFRYERALRKGTPYGRWAS